jgi:hypothetical protein
VTASVHPAGSAQPQGAVPGWLAALLAVATVGTVGAGFVYVANGLRWPRRRRAR